MLRFFDNFKSKINLCKDKLLEKDNTSQITWSTQGTLNSMCYLQSLHWLIIETGCSKSSDYLNVSLSQYVCENVVSNEGLQLSNLKACISQFNRERLGNDILFTLDRQHTLRKLDRQRHKAERGRKSACLSSEVSWIFFISYTVFHLSPIFFSRSMIIFSNFSNASDSMAEKKGLL